MAVLTACSDNSRDQLPFLCPDTGAPLASTAINVDVQVDFSQAEAVPTLSGVLHGVTDQTPFHTIADLKLASARVNANSYFGDVFAVHGITPVFVVSDVLNLQGR